MNILNLILYCDGIESIIPGILVKTLKVFAISLQFEFNYLVRSNMSTEINFDLMQKYLMTHKMKYGGSQIYMVNKLDPPYGIYDDRYKGTKYVQGTGIIMDRNLLEQIVQKKDEFDYNVIDDVSIGLFCNTHQIYPEHLLAGYKKVENFKTHIDNIL